MAQFGGKACFVFRIYGITRATFLIFAPWFALYIRYLYRLIFPIVVTAVIV